MSASYDSSAFVTVEESVAHAATNKMTLTNGCEKVSISGVVMDDKPALKDYMQYILDNTVELSLDESFSYRPEWVSKNVYGTNDLWYLVLWSSGCQSKLDFRPVNGKIKIFDPSKLDKLNEILESRKKRLKNSAVNPVAVDDLTIERLIL